MTRYEAVKRAERVVIRYSRSTTIEEGQTSKVYKVSTMWTPSGEHYTLLVWSKKANKCVWVRYDDCDVLVFADEFIHEIR